MSDPIFQVAVAAAELKLAAPKAYDNFIEAFRSLEEKFKRDLIAAEPNVIFSVQGKTWLITHLRQKLETCFDAKAQHEKRK